MIVGLHAIIYSHDAAADRAFPRDVIGFSFVDAGGGWLISAAPRMRLLPTLRNAMASTRSI